MVVSYHACVCILICCCFSDAVVLFVCAYRLNGCWALCLCGVFYLKFVVLNNDDSVRTWWLVSHRGWQHSKVPETRGSTRWSLFLLVSELGKSARACDVCLPANLSACMCVYMYEHTPAACLYVCACLSICMSLWLPICVAAVCVHHYYFEDLIQLWIGIYDFSFGSSRVWNSVHGTIITKQLCVTKCLDF